MALSTRIPALTVHNPWAWALLHGKPVENRSWKISYRGPLWLHAGKAWDGTGASSPLVQRAWRAYMDPAPPANQRMGARDILLSPDSAAISSGAVIALLNVTGCHHSSECTSASTRAPCSSWAVRGQYHIQVSVLAELDAPVPCDGRQKIWALPEEIEAAARAQLPAVEAPRGGPQVPASGASPDVHGRHHLGKD